MKKPTAALSIVLLATACGGGSLTADDFRSGLPGTQTAALELPGDTAQPLTADGYGTLDQALEGQTSDFYRLTRDMTRLINGGVGFVLVLVRAVTLQRPTSIGNGAAVWGPFRPDEFAPNEWRLTVTHLGGQDFEYVFEGRPKDSGDDAWLVVLSGHHTRVVGANGRPLERFGSGDFLIDFEQLVQLPEQNPNMNGSLEVSYSRLSETDPVDIAVGFHGVKDETSGRTIEATYAYHKDPGVGGEFQFIVDNDVDGGAKLEQLSIKSRWNMDGAGRSDVRATGGDLTADATVSECWDSSFASTYESVSWSQDPKFNYGDEAGCLFQTASYPSL